MRKQEAILKIRGRKLNAPKSKKISVKWLYPTGLEREYHKNLRSLTSTFKKMITEIIFPQVPNWLDEVKEKMPEVRQDDYLDDLDSQMIFIRQSIQPKIDETIIDAEHDSRRINRFNKNQFEKVTHSFFGIDIFQEEPWLLDQLKLFANQNALLIPKMVDEELSRVSEIIQIGLQEGKTYKTVKEELAHTFGISDRKAKFIARDQTKKLNSNLTRLRQEELGVTKYKWATSMDERVRPTHKANEGKIFEWAHPPSITGHPGNDPLCRCVALPILEGIND